MRLRFFADRWGIAILFFSELLSGSGRKGAVYLKKKPAGKKKKYLGAAAAFAALLLLTAALGKLAGLFREKNERAARLDASSEEKIAAFIKRGGFSAAQTPETTEQKRIPAVLGGTFERLNELLKSQGFDLNLYRGETAEIRRYPLKNSPKGEKGLRLVLILSGGRIAGAYLERSSPDGEIFSLDLSKRIMTFEAP